MQWKLVLKTSVLVGVMLIIANIVGLFYSVNQFYGGATILELLLFVSMYVVALVSTFNFIYRKTIKFRVIQSILTAVLSIIFGYIFSIVFIFAYLRLFS